ncbi:MAG: hypothetical protein NPMRTH1_50016 [Nitrosopumilales archaeon]|nr:MAG: hypothetical protein NPMRTH1_50016 [Nitrosopumilales archaeon]
MSDLTPQEVLRRVELTEKLKTKVLNPNEADELNGILEKEKKKASTGGDFLAFLAILFLIGLVADYLSNNK